MQRIGRIVIAEKSQRAATPKPRIFEVENSKRIATPKSREFYK